MSGEMKQLTLTFDPPLNLLNPETVARTRMQPDAFREGVRNILGLSWDARDAAILDAIRHLQEVAESINRFPGLKAGDVD